MNATESELFVVLIGIFDIFIAFCIAQIFLILQTYERYSFF
jgi:hypothetical protein